jgi:hypothetical protein
MGGGATLTGVGAQAATALMIMIALKLLMPRRINFSPNHWVDSTGFFPQRKALFGKTPKENGPVVSHRAILHSQSERRVT